ncbi:MAG: SCO2523 family variant P-loop protein [Actinomycetota bacterium]|nr:SCO2523 family variant P-loop protein [Actinomycetota bacterium]
MLVFATSDKGGTGRSVTGCNVAYRRALQGGDVCYLDFDFGSPTAGAIFEVTSAAMGVDRGGLHSTLLGRVAEPTRVDIWNESERGILRGRPARAGQLVLMPGDSGGGEFPMNDEVVRRCAELFMRVEEEFELCIVDLSAGRSHAIDMALEVTGRPELRGITTRWLVFHRWTRQHIMAASGLVFGARGLLRAGVAHGHDENALRDSIRFVRTAVLDPSSTDLAQIRPAQAAWLENCNRDLQELAARLNLGRSMVLGQTPLDPVLQWREQLISDSDVTASHIANAGTALAFDDLAKRLTDESAWEGL